MEDKVRTCVVARIEGVGSHCFDQHYPDWAFEFREEHWQRASTREWPS